MTGLSYLLAKKVKSVPAKLAITVIICTLMSWSVALELYLLTDAPFWFTYLTVALGEFGACLLGAVIVWILNTRIDLSK